MKSVKVIVAVGILAACCITCTPDAHKNDNPAIANSPPVSPPPDQFAESRKIYKAHCLECHGENGDGGEATVEGKNVKVPSLKIGHALKHSEKDFVAQITDGGDSMPAFKDKLMPEEISDLARFIRSVFQQK